MDELREKIKKIVMSSGFALVDSTIDEILALLPQWISVEKMDEYPTEEGWYWVKLSKYINSIRYFTKEDTKWFKENGTYFSLWAGPLPQPPKEGVKESTVNGVLRCAKIICESTAKEGD
jgi:hypothetical protein